jgi:predicted nucleic acid-binding protein
MIINYPKILLDTGVIVAFYDKKDVYHYQKELIS